MRTWDCRIPRCSRSKKDRNSACAQTPRRNLALTFAIYNLWQQSETIINPDVGEDSAGPPSRRYGFEINLTYQINRWLEFYGSYLRQPHAFHASLRRRHRPSGHYITDAPVATGALALYLTHLGPWSGGLDYRYLGNYPLSSGPCNDSPPSKTSRGRDIVCERPDGPGSGKRQGVR